MKKITTLLIAVLMVLCLSSIAKAAPMYYTFTGSIDAAGVADAAGAAAAAGLSNGSAVPYTFLVDRALAGTATRYDGTTYTFTDTTNTDHYYTELVSAKPIVNQNGGYAPYMTGTYNEQMNVGYEVLTGTLTDHNALMSGSLTEFSSVTNNYQSPYQSMASWTVGTTGFRGYSSAYDSTGMLSTIYSHLTLTSISRTNPLSSVPEPSTLLLLGSGLVGLGFVRRRLKK